MWIPYQPNEKRKRGNDCTIRAMMKLTGKSWLEVYWGICVCGAIIQDMPSTNDVWAMWLKKQGYSRSVIPNSCPDCYTVADFCADYPTGKYLVVVPQHVVAVVDGDYYDLFDSGDEAALYYWEEDENDQH